MHFLQPSTIRMTVRLRLALVCLFPVVCAVAASAETERWHSFEWGSATIAGRYNSKTFILLPATVDGAACKLQLDTGANAAFIWSSSVQVDREEANQDKRDVAIELAGKHMQITATAAQLTKVHEPGCGGGKLASIGNAFFDDGSLVLDLPHARYAFEQRSVLSAHPDAHAMRYRIPGWSGGLPLVDIELTGNLNGLALLDTGAARFGLSVFKETDWSQATGGLALRAGPAVEEYQVASWGRQITCLESATMLAFHTAGQQFTGAPISICPGVAKPSLPIFGLLGLRPFLDRKITLDYVSEKWLLE
jgi:hypothetical protein